MLTADELRDANDLCERALQTVHRERPGVVTVSAMYALNALNFTLAAYYRALQRGERLDSLATAVRALAEEVRDRAGNDRG